MNSLVWFRDREARNIFFGDYPCGESWKSYFSELKLKCMEKSGDVCSNSTCKALMLFTFLFYNLS